MGSSSSRLDSPSSATKPSGTGSNSKLKLTKHKLSSLLICGSSTSQSALKAEDCHQGSPISSAETLAPDTDSSWNSIAESSLSFGSEAATNTSSRIEIGASSTSSNDTTQKTFLSTINRESNDKEVVSQQSQNLVSANASSVDPRISAREDVPLVGAENENLSSLTQDDSISYPDGDNEENNEVSNLDLAIPRSLTVSPFTLTNFQSSGDVNSEMLVPSSSSGLHMSESNNIGRGDAFHVDVVSISSSILSSERSGRESRSSNRSLFWDAVSRHGYRRNSNSDFAPTIVFATGFAEDPGSHDRWLLDLSGDLDNDRIRHHSGYLGSRSRLRNGRRWLLRSEIAERAALHGHEERGRETAFCSSGLHPDGTCSCDSFFSDEEESSTLASISRVILLAEALFENFNLVQVLDEIHRQPLLSSLSMLTLPAPESTVDSFPLKYYKKSKAAESIPSDAPQCYICLSEYDDGDKLRVLPCRHEFHMPCVDKWLKEINRVCPVCRSNVCEGGTGNESVSNGEMTSQ